MKNIIYDGDMGGDDLWAVAVLASLVKQQKINLMGVTTCFGNTNVAQGTRNVLDMMALVGLHNIPVYQGLDKPISGLEPLLDEAYGSNGLSNATLPTSTLRAQTAHATDWMAETLLTADAPVTIICTGPISNIAKIYQDHPDLDGKGHEILWLGGSICPAGAGHMPVLLPDGTYKGGNITDFAEFNAINDPVAAQIIADLPTTKVTIIPLDCTQHMVIGVTQTTEFMRDMKRKNQSDIAVELVSMLDNAANLDQMKFHVLGAFLHDPQVIAYFNRPDLFMRKVPVTDLKFTNNAQAAEDFDAVASGFNFALLGRHGQMTATPCQQSNKFIVPGLTSFVPPKDRSAEAIKEMNLMAADRWGFLKENIAKSFTP